MLNRYQTGPLVTVLFIASALALCGFGLFGALRFHHPYGWLSTLNSLYYSSSFTNISDATKTS
jgi:hypothetical protein